MTTSTITTLDGSIVSASITGITAHAWTADATGLYTTTANLQPEWQSAYATMLAGHADTLTVLQRLEGNAEAVIDNTAAAKLSAAAQAQFRQDTQREFDATYAAMVINQARYGTDPNAQFNADTYLQMEETLQQNEQLKTLALEGHGLNTPPSPAYNGFTTDFQNKVDGKTLYVGGGLDTGRLAIANFFDDAIITHASFPTVYNNGVLTQLNQNGNLEDSLANVVAAANVVSYQRVYVASDFSTDPNAVGATMLVQNPLPAPPLPAPAAPLTGVTSFDGAITPETITGLTAHTWTADGTGLYGTLTDLGAEWKADYAIMLAGRGNTLTALERIEGNAEAVVENTNVAKLTAPSLAAFRQDAQRCFDAIDAAMRIDQVTYGIDPTIDFTATTYQQLEATLQGNETLKELTYQGHGLNNPPVSKYSGYTTDFQNRVDGTTFYVGGGPDTARLAIPNLFDDVIITHASFPIVEHNGVLTQLNQNGTFEDILPTVLIAANETAFDRVFVAADFSTSSTATGPTVAIRPGSLLPPGAGTGIGTTSIAAGVTTTMNPDGSSIITATTGGNTIQITSGTVNTGPGGNAVMCGAGAVSVQSGGRDTITGGTGALTVTAGAGGDTVFAGSGGLTFTGGTGTDVIVGGGKPVTANGGADTSIFFGGGNATLTAGTGGQSVLIGGNGDRLYSAGPVGDLFGAQGGGTLLMSGVGSTGNDVFFGAGGTGALTFITGSGNDLLGMGQGTNTVTLGAGFDVVFANTGTTGVSTITMGTGTAAIALGGQSVNVIIAAQPGATRALDLYGYTTGADKITLTGFSPNAAATAIANQVSANGGTLLQLGDGTSIALVGVTHASASLFG